MRIGLKLALVFLMTLAILVPLSMVRGVIHEREAYRAGAVADVESSFAGPQAVAGPVLTVPFVEWVDTEQADPTGVVRRVRKRQDGVWTFFPQQLDVGGRLAPDVRRRGIYEVRLYTWHGAVAANFDVRIPDDAPAGAERVIGRPWLSYGITDVRGLRGSPRIRIDGREFEPREGFGPREGSGLNVQLDAPAPGAAFRLATRLDVDLAGAESLAVVPLGKRNRIDLSSPWPHPDFRGMSPWHSEIGEGFAAHWQVASVATDVQRQYLAGAMAQAIKGAAKAQTQRGQEGVAATQAGLDSLGVVLAEPVDAYTQADRATKYGLLFVLLTFVGFFMFELIKQLPIHPIQYALVGLALAIFFLLLVSLSEHLEFGISYLLASIACIGLIGFYLSAVLRSAVRGSAFAAMLALLYAALYGLLISEDNALVLGAGLLFVILAGIMTLTRKLDWYRLGAQLASTRAA